MRFSVKLATFFVVLSGAIVGFTSAATADSGADRVAPAASGPAPVSPLTLVWD